MKFSNLIYNQILKIKFEDNVYKSVRRMNISILGPKGLNLTVNNPWQQGYLEKLNCLQSQIALTFVL